MHDVIARLRTQPSLEVIDREHSWEIRAHKPEGLVFEITVPHSVLEWFVTARRTSPDQEVWNDWMDYYAVAGETETELRSAMARHIERFIDRLLAAKVRVVESRAFLRRRQRLEWRTAGEWEKISLYEDVV